MLKKTSHRILTLVFGLGALRLLRKLYKLYRQKPLDPAGLEINSFEGRQRLADEFTELFKAFMAYLKDQDVWDSPSKKTQNAALRSLTVQFVLEQTKQTHILDLSKDIRESKWFGHNKYYRPTQGMIVDRIGYNSVCIEVFKKAQANPALTQVDYDPFLRKLIVELTVVLEDFTRKNRTFFFPARA